jgi:hypothetical protein
MAPPISQEIKDELYDLYYTKQNYFGRDKLYELSLINNIDVSRRQIADWLSNQEVNQLFRRHEKASKIIPTVLKKQNSQIGIDLIDFQNHEYNGFKWILTAIDLFSKKSYAFPIKSKESNETTQCIEKMIKQIGTQISVLRSDNGPEFKNEKFQNVLKKNQIKHVFSSAYTPQSNGQIERFNGILKQLIMKSLYVNDSKDWVSILPNLIDNYNNSFQSTVADTPNNVHDQSKEENEKTYLKIKENVQNLKNEKIRFEIGDTVRVFIEKAPNSEVPENEKQQWSKKLYVISKIFKPKNNVAAPYYYITDKNDNDIQGKFYNNDLLIANKVDNEKTHEEKFIVSKLVEPKVQNGEAGYIVAWKNYRKLSDRTFEKRERLIEDVPKLVKAYEDANGYFYTSPKGVVSFKKKNL